MRNFFAKWLPIILLLLIPIAFLVSHVFGYEIYIINSDKYPWIIDSEHFLLNDSLSKTNLELLLTLKQEGLVLSPQEYTNHTFNFFSWLLTILVSIIGIVVLVFALNVEKKIDTTLNVQLKSKWLELMRIDKEVDSTIGGIIDDKIEGSVSDLSYKMESLDEKIKGIEQNYVKF